MEGDDGRQDLGESVTNTLRALRETAPAVGVTLCCLSLVAVDPASAQTVGESFCETDMATTIKNLFTLIQFGGPLVGGVVALGATVAIPLFRRADTKKELKSMRAQGVIWGVIVAPLGTTILQFLLSAVVAGGSSCSF